ncbi:hypothetical protein MKX03_017564 [Papaver bracteatum]|nr:hypothetical protein MKX03_017564 [Papaver bracteatum]
MLAASCLASCCAACACEACLTVVSSISRRINHFAQTPDREWFETDAVLHVSSGNFLFFTILAIIMIGVKDQKDPRDRLHHGGWMMKVVSWCLMVIFMFFLPNGFVSFYESISKFGSGLFLLVQVVLLYIALFVVSLVCYVATFSFSGLLFHFLTPSWHDCGLNTFFICIPVHTLGRILVISVYCFWRFISFFGFDFVCCVYTWSLYFSIHFQHNIFHCFILKISVNAFASQTPNWLFLVIVGIWLS